MPHPVKGICLTLRAPESPSFHFPVQSVSRRDGTVVGGHVMAGRIFTTLELVVGTLPGVHFCRETDDATGFDELVVRSCS